MFTGIIQDVGTVRGIDRRGNTLVITVESPLVDSLGIGDSVSVNGPCLTVVELDAGRGTFTVEVMPETYRKTTLQSLSPGSEVNLEPALELGDSLGGHFVTGHVDGVGTVRDVTREENARMYAIRPPDDLLPYIAPKGSISVDGVSLTVVDVDEAFTVSVTDFTWEHTVFRDTGVGDEVNVEVDMIARYLARLADAGQTGEQGMNALGQDVGAARDRDGDATVQGHDMSTDEHGTDDRGTDMMDKLRQLEGGR